MNECILYTKKNETRFLNIFNFNMKIGETLRPNSRHQTNSNNHFIINAAFTSRLCSLQERRKIQLKDTHKLQIVLCKNKSQNQ